MSDMKPFEWPVYAVKMNGSEELYFFDPSLGNRHNTGDGWLVLLPWGEERKARPFRPDNRVIREPEEVEWMEQLNATPPASVEALREAAENMEMVRAEVWAVKDKMGQASFDICEELFAQLRTALSTPRPPEAAHEHDFCIQVWKPIPGTSPGFEQQNYCANYRCGCGALRFDESRPPEAGAEKCDTPTEAAKKRDCHYCDGHEHDLHAAPCPNMCHDHREHKPCSKCAPKPAEAGAEPVQPPCSRCNWPGGTLREWFSHKCVAPKAGAEKPGPQALPGSCHPWAQADKCPKCAPAPVAEKEPKRKDFCFAPVFGIPTHGCVLEKDHEGPHTMEPYRFQAPAASVAAPPSVKAGLSEEERGRYEDAMKRLDEARAEVRRLLASQDGKEGAR